MADMMGFGELTTVTPADTLRDRLLAFIAGLGYNPADVEQVVGTPTTFTVWYRIPMANDPTQYRLQSDGYYLH